MHYSPFVLRYRSVEGGLLAAVLSATVARLLSIITCCRCRFMQPKQVSIQS